MGLIRKRMLGLSTCRRGAIQKSWRFLIFVANKSSLRVTLLFLSLFAAIHTLPAQRGVGFRFATGLNYFYRGEEHPVVDGWWSHLVVGPYYQAVFSNGGYQVGLHLIHKGQLGQKGGGLSLPIVMRDITKGQNVGITAIEGEVKVGPRFGPINPRMGFEFAYILMQRGWTDDTTQTVNLNKTYFTLPFGFSAEFPTQYGSVGFGVYYKVGLSNVIARPPGYPGDWNGSRLRSLQIEVTNLFNAGKQKPRRPPEEE
jgi:hypothetical protein